MDGSSDQSAGDVGTVSVLPHFPFSFQENPFPTLEKWLPKTACRTCIMGINLHRFVGSNEEGGKEAKSQNLLQGICPLPFVRPPCKSHDVENQLFQSCQWLLGRGAARKIHRVCALMNPLVLCDHWIHWFYVVMFLLFKLLIKLFCLNNSMR